MDADRTRRARRLAFRTVLVATFWLALPLAILELGLRAVERQLWIDERTIAPGAPVFPLDELGYAEDPVLARAARDELRILSLGDSFAESIVEPAATYARHLERGLAPRLDRPVRVINLGRGGTSFPGYLHQLDTWRERLAADAVIVNVYAGNDFDDAGSEIAGPGAAADVAPVSTMRPVTIRTGPGTRVPRRHLLRIADWIHAIWLQRALDPEHAVPAGYRPRTLQMSEGRYLRVQANVARPYREGTLADDPDALASLAGLLERLASLEANGTRTLVFVSPPEVLVSAALRERVRGRRSDLGELDPTLPARAVRAVAEQVGYPRPIVDLTACLRAAEQADAPLYYPRNTHWSLEGNRVVGAILTATIAGAWFPGDLPPREGDCLAAPASSPSPALARAAHEAIDRSRLGAPLLAPLATESPRDRAQVERALEGAGRVQREPVDVRVERLLVKPGFVLIGGGVAVDDDANSSVVAFLVDGRPLAAATLGPATANPSERRFSLRPSLRCDAPGPPPRIELIVLSADGYRWGRPSKPIPCRPDAVMP